jgi:hypothetical protein
MAQDLVFAVDPFALSERNKLKVDFNYILRREQTAKQKEIGLYICLANIPSRYFRQGFEAQAVDSVLQAIREHTSFYFGPGQPVVIRELPTFTLESSFLLKYVGREDLTRVWTGSYNIHNRNQRAGRLMDNFEDLVSREQLIRVLQRFRDGEPILGKLSEPDFLEVDTKWRFSGLISVVAVIWIEGVFPQAYRGKRGKVILSNN